MGASQLEIAAAVGLDVSSVNKILSGKKGAVFQKKTIEKVMSAAKRLGYDFTKPLKGVLVQTLQELFPAGIPERKLAQQLGITEKRVAEIKALIARASGAAIVLLTLLDFVLGK